MQRWARPPPREREAFRDRCPHLLARGRTVGVVRTPRAGSSRPWDTTVISTNGPPAYDEEYDRLPPLLAAND